MRLPGDRLKKTSVTTTQRVDQIDFQVTVPGSRALLGSGVIDTVVASIDSITNPASPDTTFQVVFVSNAAIILNADPARPDFKVGDLEVVVEDRPGERRTRSDGNCDHSQVGHSRSVQKKARL